MQKHNVLIVAARYFPYMGGTETHIYEVGRRLVRKDINITILTTMPPASVAPSAPREEIIEGMHIIRVRSFPTERDYYIAPEMIPIIKHGQWDLIHCQGCHTLVPPLAMRAAKEAKIPYVVTFHTGGHSSSFRNSIRGLQWKLQASFFAQAERLIGVSHYESSYFCNLLHLPSAQFTVIPNGVTVPAINAMQASDTKQTQIISIGRLERYKGHQHIVRALPLIRKWRNNARLLILGSGPYEGALRELICKSGIEEHVEIDLIPPSNRKKMAETLAQASLVTLLSEYEAHPMAIMEALALRRPVLATDTSGMVELAAQGFIRTIPLHSSSEEVARAVRQQIEEPITLPTDFLPTWDDCARQVQDVYFDILGRRELCAS